ncbi:MAG: hypothetical protein IJ719_17600 [Clostridia bacterium]|nr:hypothetical protein [Clostridia bacterium]
MARPKKDVKKDVLDHEEKSESLEKTEKNALEGSKKAGAQSNECNALNEKKAPKKGSKSAAENLIPITKRTKDEQRRICSQGGKKSGEVRRRQSNARKAAEYVAGLNPPLNDKTLQLFKSAGLEDPTFAEAIAYVMARKALEKQDVQAAKLFLEMTGQDAETRRHREKLDFEREKYRLEHPNAEKDDLNAQIASIAQLINSPVRERTLESIQAPPEETKA